MKKVVYAIIFFGLINGAANAQNSNLYETVSIPAQQQVKSVGIEQNQILKPEQQNTQIKSDLKVEGNIFEPVMNILGSHKNPVKVIFSEADGIIVPENYKGIIFKDSIYTSFTKLEKNNIPFIFTTARTFREAKRIANALNYNPDYYITQNGAEITDAYGNIIYDNFMSYSRTRSIKREVDWFNSFYNQDLKIAFYNKGMVYTYRNSNIPNLVDIPKEIDRMAELPKSGYSKIKIYGPNAHTLAIFKRYIERNHKSLNINIVSSNSFDITDKTSTKANAVEILSKKLGYDLKNAAAFGYAENDYALLNLIRANGGVTISTPESRQEIKDSSSYITKDFEHDGFAFAIDTILGNNKILKQK